MPDDPPQATPENPPANIDPSASALPADVVPADVVAADAAAPSTEAPPIEPALAGAASADAPPVVDTSASDAAAIADVTADGSIDQAAIDELLKQAAFEDPTAAIGGLSAADGAADVAGEPFELPNFNQVMADAQISSIDLLRDVELNVKIELGRSRMLVEDVLKLGEGSVVELDKLAGDPVDVFVNDRLVARGEVLVLNENFCVRVNEIVAGIKDEGQ
ncbi:hypothetical protein BH09PLA1_BH09PLA1_28750 [soil metagenome]